ncbi:LuxR C-terminal-related transcriptional regulator [Streptomyces sp. I05A-00742]|uniref:LuxR C-terminal-related transcriptional regulator n=1 Tax=Streptomyces sp. I05A-00742 TaxID=2732853 RepID=UPI0014893889|nr:LuxR family transcriptional regulator [Streptomyces sp. I05A-00742]
MVGREADLDAIGALLTAGRGVLLAGDHGVGKNRLARAVLARMAGAGHEVRWIRAARGTRGMPYGALLEWLGPDLVDLIAEPTRMGAAVAARMRERIGGGLLLGVIDAHLLDPESADLLHQMVVVGRVNVIATIHADAVAPEGVNRLWVERLAERYEVRPFDRAAVSVLLNAALGGAVEERTVDRMYAVTLGNALFLRELVCHALAQNSLRPMGRAWLWTGRINASGRLLELVRVRLGDLDPEETELVGLVALAEPLVADLPLLREFARAAESLNKRGILLAEGEDLRLRLAFPLYSEVIVATMPPLTARRLRTRLVEAIEEAGPRLRGDRMRLTALRADAGLPVPAAELLDAARAAVEQFDFVLAERLCRSAQAAQGGKGPDHELRLVLARALTGLGRHDEADDILDVGVPGVPDPSESAAPHSALPAVARAELVRARALNLAKGLRRVQDAHDVLDAALETLPAEDTERLHGARALMWTMEGRITEVADAGRKLLPCEPPESRLKQSLVPAVAIARTELGDAAGALELLEQCVPALDVWEGRAWLDHQVATTIASFLMGRLPEAGEALVRLRRRSEREEWTAGLTQTAMLQARLDRAMGRLPRALALLQKSVTLQGDQDLCLLSRSWTLARIAGVLAEMGHRAQALRTLAEARTLQKGDSSYQLVVGGVGTETVVVHAYAGDRTGAVQHALRLADRCAAGGWTAREMDSLHLAARIGDPVAVAERVARRARGATSGYLRLQADHVAALATADAEALAEVGQGFRAAGLLPLAAEATAQSARAHRAAGRRRSAARGEEASAELVASYGGRLPPWAGPSAPSRSAAGQDLTSREREIAVLAASGLANREIAAQLVVSVRTIENHLQRAYGKLGIDSRGDLAEALAA